MQPDGNFNVKCVLMIGGSLEALQNYISHIKLNFGLDANSIFAQFKLIPIEGNLWVFAFCHHAYDWRAEAEWTWSDMYTYAEAIGLTCVSKIVRPLEDCTDTETPEAYGHRQTLSSLVNESIAVHPKVAAFFNY